MVSSLFLILRSEAVRPSVSKDEDAAILRDGC